MTPIPPYGPYSVIYADPPWHYDDTASAGARGAVFKYPVMTDEDIYALPVRTLAAKDCALFLWGTWPKIREAIATIDAWGFTYKTLAFDWIKQNPKTPTLFWGMGRWTRSNSEFVLLATRGKPSRVSAGVHSIVMAPRGAHSAKPAEVRDRIVTLCGDVPRIELFAREVVEGWDAWGPHAGIQNVQLTLKRFKAAA